MVDIIRPERRLHPRRPLGAAMRVVLLPANRDFPCLCADVSAGGARLLVPAAMPVGAGQAVRLADFSGRLGQLAELSGSDPAATVVRVDRQTLLSEGVITLGARFDAPGGNGQTPPE